MQRVRRDGSGALGALIGAAFLLGLAALLLSGRSAPPPADPGLEGPRHLERLGGVLDHASAREAPSGRSETVPRSAPGSSEPEAPSRPVPDRSGASEPRPSSESSARAPAGPAPASQLALLGVPDAVLFELGHPDGPFVYSRSRGWLRRVGGEWVPVTTLPADLLARHPTDVLPLSGLGVLGQRSAPGPSTLRAAGEADVEWRPPDGRVRFRLGSDPAGEGDPR